MNTDETGDTTGVVDTANGRTWLAETNQSSIHGQTTVDQYTGAAGYGGTRTYTYDQASRLTTTFDQLTAAGTCTTRAYGFDKNSNRTSSTVFNPAADGSCQTSTAASSASHSYDIADRLQPAGTDAGLVYDAFGRITTLPSADTGNAGGNATIGYYANDLVRSQTQAGVTDTWSLDAAGRLAAWTNSSSGVTKTNHYDDASSDSPDWIAENTAGTNWTRNITDLSGNLAATCDQAGTLTWQINNIHGDTIATATNTDLEPSTYYLTDEYGLPIGTAQPARYGWLGGKQRSHDDLAGLTLMGVRLYTPILGRFLQTDSVPGGSCNTYDYTCADPINKFDLDGRCWNPLNKKCGTYNYGHWLWYAGKATYEVGSYFVGAGEVRAAYRGYKAYRTWRAVRLVTGKSVGSAIGVAFGAQGLWSDLKNAGHYWKATWSGVFDWFRPKTSWHNPYWSRDRGRIRNV